MNLWNFDLISGPAGRQGRCVPAQQTLLMAEKKRCPWCLKSDLYMRYHDDEWGVPVHDDRTHFEFLILEGAQAGLSWSTILNKREGYRKCFADFDPEKVARFSEKRIAISNESS